MPENLENESLTPEPIAAEVTPEPVVETPEVKQVPLADLLEERHSRQELQQQVEQLKGSTIQLQQHLMAMQASAASPQEKLDPEIQKLLDPYLAPFRAQLAQTEQSAMAAREALALQQKMEFVRANLPELDSIGAELAKEIGSMDKAEQDVFLSNPRAIVRLGKAIVKEKQGMVATAAKTAARASGRTETGSTSTASAADAVTDQTDWSKMSSEEFNNNPLVRAMRL